MNMAAERTTPIIHENFFWAAPTYSGFCLLTINLPIISVGAYFGVINTRIIKSVKKTVITYLIIKKLPLNSMNMSDRKVKKNRMPAAARISRSLSTGILYPGTVSPNCVAFFIKLSVLN